jgi:ribonucleoside-triphosphate reductase
MITIDGVEYTEDCFEPTGTSAKTRSHIKKTLRDRLKDTYGSNKYKEFLKIQGFDDARFDYVGSVMNMMYADLTTDGIDNNANKDSKSVSRVEAEVDNANHKIAGHDALYRMMKKLYGKDEAVRLSSEMYDYTLGLNDATKILRVYCWALSGIPLVLEGRKGNPVCAPAKHLHSYVSMLAGTIHELSNSHLAGAIAVGSFFFDVARVLIMDGYSLDDIKEGAGRKYVTQMFQQFVFDVNDKTRIGSETPFTNLSFFDRPKMRAMLEDLEWYFDAT